MTADTAATLAVLTLPVLAAVLTVRAVARHNYIRRALTVQKNRREWARAAYRTARTEWRTARARYRQARRRAVADKYRTDRAAKRERRDIRRAHRAYHMHRRKYRIR
jgi:hypothetical protein